MADQPVLERIRALAAGVRQRWPWVGRIADASVWLDTALGALKIFFSAMLLIGGAFLVVWLLLIRSFGVFGTVVLIVGLAAIIVGGGGLWRESRARRRPVVLSEELPIPTSTFHREVAGAAPQSSGRLQPQDRVVVDATPEYLTGFFKGRLAIQAQRLAEPFVGKWMTISGPIGSVGAWNHGFLQATFNRPGAATVYLIFRDRSAVDRLSVLKHGDRITAFGRIDRIDADNIQLSPCELVEVVVTPVRDQLIAARAKGIEIRDQVIDVTDKVAVSDWRERHKEWRSQTYDWLRREVEPMDALLFGDLGEIGDLVEAYTSMHDFHRASLDRELSNLTKLIERLG